MSDEPASTSTPMQAPSSPSPSTLLPAVQLPQAEETEDGVIFPIGGEKIVVPPFTFRTLKRCWDLMNKLGSPDVTSDVIVRTDTLLEILVIALEKSSTPLTKEEMTDRLRTNELLHMSISYRQLLVRSGLLDPTIPLQPVLLGPEAEATAPGNGSTPSSNGLAAGVHSTPTDSLTDEQIQALGLGSEPPPTAEGPTSIQ
jgi:hypothetical protein